MKSYSWRRGSHHPRGLRAEVAAAELEKIENQHGELTPETVVREAKNKRSPLHSAFEWDDKAAAEQHRLQQARQLIASIEVIYDHSQEIGPSRAFVNVDYDEAGQSYHSTDRAMTVPEVRNIVLSRALQEASSWQRRYQTYAELSSVFEAIEVTKKKISKVA